MASMALRRWDPMHDLLTLQRRLDRFAAGPARWVPPIDLVETPDAYLVTAEVPGVTRDDLRIDVQEGRLTLSGVRPQADGGRHEYHRIERGHGAFSRSFQLPHPIDAGAITAELKHGVLSVTCPKRADSGARRIDVE
jgi:HSP20 family protein